MNGALLLWWSVLCAAAAVNVAAWAMSAWLFEQRKSRLSPEIHATRRALLWLGAVYVLGCAFRSVLPMVDAPRYCLHDTWVSRIFVGRSVATVAELAFAMQWALLLREAGAVRASRAVVPLLVAAEVLSWAAVLTGNNLFHAAENSLWTVTAGFAAAFLVSRWPHERERGRRVIAGAASCGAAYIAFMVTVDVPMYLARWHPGQEQLSVAQGVGEILRRCVVTRDWAHWHEDALSLGLYFTVAVWFSIALAHVPSLKPNK